MSFQNCRLNAAPTLNGRVVLGLEVARAKSPVPPWGLPLVIHDLESRLKYVVDDDDWTVPDADEKRFLGWYAWEAHLGDYDRWRLFVARVGLAEAPEHSDHFALTHASILTSAEFCEDLEEAGDDPGERALVRLEAELNSYW